MQINHPKKIILASQSPRRVAILNQMGFDCVVMPADIDESQLLGEMPTDYVLRLAKQKALAIVNQLNGQQSEWQILAADTTVALKDTIFGKPENDSDAFSMLKQLSGTQHQVHTAVAVVFNHQLKLAINTTLVEMITLTDAMITAYVATGEHKDKAGSYAIQGLAGSWIKRIDGSYTGVMGLPVHETAMLLGIV